MQSNMNDRPWYKHKMLLLVISVPVLSVVISFFLLFMSFNTTDSLVDDNWYLDGKALEMDLSKDANASLFNTTAQLSYVKGIWKAKVNSSAAVGSAKALQLNLRHTTRKELDRSIELHKVAPNSYASTTPMEDSGMIGRYSVEISGVDWRLNHKANWPVNSISMHPLPLSATQLPERP